MVSNVYRKECSLFAYCFAWISLRLSSVEIRIRLQNARELQNQRFTGSKIYSNAKMRSQHISRYCLLQPDAQSMIEMAMQKLGLSARAYTRILKVSRTIADLADSEDISAEHVAEAIQYRTLDRGYA
ncbi:hypothetical protein H8E50_08835 [bacterium]|nr:hypothetical protein [bacterium]